MTRTLSCGPSMLINTLCSLFMREQISEVSAVAGSSVSRFRTNSIPTKRPRPLTSPISSCFVESCRICSQTYLPTLAALSCSPSRRKTSSTAKPAAQQTGLPPKVLKYSKPLWKASDTSFVVTTAARGMPFPKGLPMVTMSGTTPCSSNAQK